MAWQRCSHAGSEAMAMCQRRKRQLHTPDGHSSPSPAPAPAGACTHHAWHSRKSAHANLRSRAKRASISSVSVHARHGDGVAGERRLPGRRRSTAPCRPPRAPAGRHAFFRRQGNGSQSMRAAGQGVSCGTRQGKTPEESICSAAPDGLGSLL